MNCSLSIRKKVFIKYLIIFLPFLSVASWGAIAITEAAGLSITVDSPVNGQVFGNTTLNVTGTATAGMPVELYTDNTLSGTTTAGTDGTWTMTIPNVTEGSHVLYAKVSDQAGSTLTSQNISFSIDLTAPGIVITKPVEGVATNSPVIEGTTDPGTTVNVYIYGQQPATVTAYGTGQWSYTASNLPDGKYSVYAVAKDNAGNTTTSATVSFTLDLNRPVILPTVYPAEDMTQVALNVYIRVYLVDNYPIDQNTLGSALQLFEKGTVSTRVYGMVYSSVAETAYGTPYYQVEFQPDALLKPSTRYSVMVNHNLTDATGNYVYPRSWEFTTISDQSAENPHGNYTDNVNTCINCHLTHRAKGLGLTNPADDKFTMIDDFCNACHDGTVAPIPDNWQEPNQHNYQMNMAGTAGPSACASCHNPHLTPSHDNPNFLKDYYTYQHNDPTNPYLPNTSEQELCESCHSSSIKDDSRVSYIRYQYRKSTTSLGTSEDYSLCLRCHDGKNATDVATYYKNPSKHLIGAKDGSFLNGHIACADCHDTHGSKNLKILKELLGHRNQRSFITQGDVWDPANERRFCTSCHNNSTELYGIVAVFNESIPGHEPVNTEYCSKCHGGTPEAAAHCPQ